jgi:hypothetical protein
MMSLPDSLHFLAAQAQLVVVGVLGEEVEVDVVRFLPEERLEVLDERREARPIVGALVPAVVHHVVDLALAVLRLLQAVTVPDLLHDLTRAHAGVRCGAWKVKVSL